MGLTCISFLQARNKHQRCSYLKKLAGKWCVVVMEEISGGKALTACGCGNFVHGDLCYQNILLLPDESIRVLDFDRAGICGQVKYPHNLNMAY